MGIKKLFGKFFLFLFFFIMVFSFAAGFVYAADGTISVEPLKGNFDNQQVFSADIRIDGGGVAFNASKASVAVSPNLRVESITLGNCGFAFVRTPSTASLSYAGVILGGSKTSCTVYTMKLKVLSQGSGYVFISDGAVKSYKGAEEILSSIKNSSYVFGNNQSVGTSSVLPTPVPTQPPLMLANGEKLYTLTYSVAAPNDESTSSVAVVLDPQLPSKVTANPSPIRENPSVLAATFNNVPEGVHTLSVLANNKPVSNEIVTITGPNREISFGTSPKQSTVYQSYIIMVVALVIALTGGVIGYIFYWKKNHPLL
jgi:hypothetical protein